MSFTEYLRPDLQCPCTKCSDRAFACSKECERYAAWRQREDQRKADIQFRADASRIDRKRAGRRDGINNWYAKNGMKHQ